VTNPINTREVILKILLEVNEEGEYSHIVLRKVLEKYQYLSKQDRAFITRVSEGTIEHMIQLDYIIDQFSKVKVHKMKPVIRNIIRSAAYQLKFMDSVPDSAICNEAVKLAQKKGFYSLKGFVNGVTRSVARNIDQVTMPDETKEPDKYLSVTYSMPEWIVVKWIEQYGIKATKMILEDFLKDKPTYVRCNLKRASKETVIESLKSQGIQVRESSYLDYALKISGYNYIKAINAFNEGLIQVQDLSSMLVAEVADPKKGDYVIDVCAAPGGKSLHIADKLMGTGFVDARDITDSKVDMMNENIERNDVINMKATVMDALKLDPESVGKADILIADVPCSGLGVMGKKTDIKYKMTPVKQAELITLQQRILHTVHEYVKVGGTLIYSTCTIGAAENQSNIKWFLENYPYKLESIDPYIPDFLKSKTTATGYLQLLPGIHKTDGFFIARLKRIK
jgi:16S rRNA (cytosine967-C5)-methyltransferase